MMTRDRFQSQERYSELDPAVTGRGAELVYRINGKAVSKEEFLKLHSKDEKPKGEERHHGKHGRIGQFPDAGRGFQNYLYMKEKKLEWGQGLAQKREAEARLQELELEKERPFARASDDPELDKMLKERVRWGDPMAHLVKRKDTVLELEDLGNDEKMKESGFVVPQAIPSHSWLKRGVDPGVNRYGIRPGRHWDGVDRSNGFERDMFKRQNDKKATKDEAYLWSVADM
ncbi:BUD13-like protein [Nymphaea thermarum]|nr:BUD13-like protein [Nymphaea thermarum]